MVAKKENNTQHNEAKFRIDDLLELEKSPFDWWKNNTKKYPNIAKVAQIYLAYQPHLCQGRGY